MAAADSGVKEALITEVMLRDGLQLESVVVATEEKAAMARDLVAAGVRSLEVGAFVNPAKVPQMADTAELVGLIAGLPAQLHTLVFNAVGARRAVDAGVRDVRLVVSASEGHSRANAGASVDEALTRLDESAEILRSADVALEASIATAFVCPFDGDTPVRRVSEVAERLVGMGVQVVHLADTIGAAHPSQIRTAVQALQRQQPDTALGLHLHNTYGMAAANAWEAIGLGVVRFDASLGGLGGCPFAPGAAGNIATDDVVHLFHREGIATGLDPERLVALRRRLAEAVGHPLESSMSRAPVPPANLASR